MKLFSFFGVLGAVLLAGCTPTDSGAPYIGAGEPCSGDGTICSSNGEELLKCDNGTLSLLEDCDAAGKDCKNGACVARSSVGDDCTGTASLCSGDKILSCQDGKLAETFDCASQNKDCNEESGTAVCVDKPAVDDTPQPDADEPAAEEPGDDGDTAEPTDSDAAGMQCTPGETVECYQGPSGSKGVGPCRAGQSLCAASGYWGPCEGQVLPTMETCLDGIDQDCNGSDLTPEEAVDIDGDGITICQGDCCEENYQCPGADPAHVTPEGAEIVGNGIDDNCNGHIDEIISCDSGLSVSADAPSSAIALAKGMGICEPWLISAELGLAGTPVSENICEGPEGSCTQKNRMSLPLPYYDNTYKTYAVESMFGSVLTAKEGMALSILSTGPWDAPTGNAAEATLAAGDMKTASTVPEDWINKQTNCTAPKAPSCGGTAPDPTVENSCAGKPQFVVQDPIMLTVKVKVPINAVAFRLNSYFCSIEYPNTVCNDANYNDFFITLLDSTYNTVNPTSTNPNPYDKNLAKDAAGNPVGVDLAPAGLFKVCNTNCKSAGGLSDTNKWGFCTGDAELAGTGFGSQTVMGMCSGNGCTGWLTTQGNVVPGEEITLRFAIFEQGTVSYGPDHSWDSTVLLDNFQWLVTETKPGTGSQE